MDPGHPVELKRRFAALGYNQDEIAGKVGVSSAQVSRWVNGIRPIKTHELERVLALKPRPGYAKAYADFLAELAAEQEAPKAEEAAGPASSLAFEVLHLLTVAEATAVFLPPPPSAPAPEPASSPEPAPVWHRRSVRWMVGAAIALGLLLIVGRGRARSREAPAGAGSARQALPAPGPFTAALPMPDKPLNGQALSPCDRLQGQKAIKGGCWFETSDKPPCAPRQYLHEGRCYVPAWVEPPPKAPTSETGG